MLAGISTACFYPELTEDVLKRLCSIPVQCAEVFANCDYEVSPAYTRELRAMADDNDVQLVSLHPYSSGFEPMLFFTHYDRRFQQGRDTYKRYYEAANRLGARFVVFHGGHPVMLDQLDFYLERYAVLIDDAKAAGVELCHENVSRCVGNSLGFFEALAKTLPSAGIVFDLKQARRSGYDVMTFVEMFGHNIRHIHMSDCDKKNDCVPPGCGVFNIDKFLSAISNFSFDGGIIIELYRENFADFDEINKSYQHLLQKLSTFSSPVFPHSHIYAEETQIYDL